MINFVGVDLFNFPRTKSKEIIKVGNFAREYTLYKPKGLFSHLDLLLTIYKIPTLFDYTIYPLQFNYFINISD